MDGFYQHDWRKTHKEVIEDFLHFLNKKTEDYVLKGGTSLMECYGLPRMSEDIDLDGKNKEIGQYVEMFCKDRGYTYRTAKDTDTVKRYFINYGNDRKPLKIEISFRRQQIPENEIRKINNITVYDINTLAIMKSGAYAARDKLRDMFDVAFIVNSYYDKLNPSTRIVLQDSISNKGIEQFDYLINNQADELIDPDKLAEQFLNAYEKLGIALEKDEIESMQQYDNITIDDIEEDLER